MDNFDFVRYLSSPEWGGCQIDNPPTHVLELWRRLRNPSFGICTDGGTMPVLVMGFIPMERAKLFHGFAWPDGIVTQTHWSQ